MGTTHRLHVNEATLPSLDRSSASPASHQKPSARSDAEAASRDYSIRSFIADHQQLSVMCGASPVPLPTVLLQVDGPMVVVVPEIRWKVDAERQRTLFRAKYGRHGGDARLMRFRLVLRFLSLWNTEIRKCGLAAESRLYAVQEELVRFLLRYKLSAREPEIPKHALDRFLVDWGHRWM